MFQFVKMNVTHFDKSFAFNISLSDYYKYITSIYHNLTNSTTTAIPIGECVWNAIDSPNILNLTANMPPPIMSDNKSYRFDHLYRYNTKCMSDIFWMFNYYSFHC